MCSVLDAYEHVDDVLPVFWFGNCQNTYNHGMNIFLKDSITIEIYFK